MKYTSSQLQAFGTSELIELVMALQTKINNTIYVQKHLCKYDTCNYCNTLKNGICLDDMPM